MFFFGYMFLLIVSYLLDGVVIYELVGVCILNVLREKYGKERLALCRDDGSACFENLSGPQAEQIRKDVIKIFQIRIRQSPTIKNLLSNDELKSEKSKMSYPLNGNFLQQNVIYRG